MKRLVLLCLALGACKNPPPPAATDAGVPAVPVASASASASAAAPKAPEGTRIKGSVSGGFAVERLQFPAGTPITVLFTMTNTSPAPLTFDLGGDASSTLLPSRYGLVVKNSEGLEVCNLAKSQPATVGGLGAAHTLKTNERYRDRVTLNGACEALLTPGKYTVTMVRRLDTLAGKDVGACNDLLPTEVLPKELPQPCYVALDTAPLIASDMTFEVTEYEKISVAKSLEPMITEAKTAKDINAHPERLAYAQFLCRRVTCNCSVPKTGEELAALMTSESQKLPAALPAKCP